VSWGRAAVLKRLKKEESYLKKYGNEEKNGRRGTRTPDIFGVNEALYQLSYSPFSISTRPQHTITDQNSAIDPQRKKL
jgi:hypothetical protein